MEQRRLRLGDILDDYCPRERRVTNHAVVAMIEEDVKQTRCTTCDAEHVYKGGKAPRRKKADDDRRPLQGSPRRHRRTRRPVATASPTWWPRYREPDSDDPEVHEQVESEDMADIDEPRWTTTRRTTTARCTCSRPTRARCTVR